MIHIVDLIYTLLISLSFIFGIVNFSQEDYLSGIIFIVILGLTTLLVVEDKIGLL